MYLLPCVCHHLLAAAAKDIKDEDLYGPPDENKNMFLAWQRNEGMSSCLPAGSSLQLFFSKACFWALVVAYIGNRQKLEPHEEIASFRQHLPVHLPELMGLVCW
jgi:hypothetical protein